jgi:WD40 repeat protein
MKRKVVLSITWGVLFWLFVGCNSFDQEPLPTLVPVIQLPEPTETPTSDVIEGLPEPTPPVNLTETDPTPNSVTAPINNRGALAYINSIGEGLFLVRPDNSSQTQFYALQNVERLLSASFNGERIGLIRDGRLFIARTDGSGIVEITAVSNPSWFVWSPSRDEFALIENGDLIVLQADSGAATRVATEMQLANIPGSVAWSPDGLELLFTCGSQATDLCRVGRDGSSAVLNITSNGADSFAWYREPAWSPDGTRISYISPDEEKNLQLFVMDPDGNNVRQLTEGRGQASLHQWSPDGERIAYASFADGEWQALAVESDGTDSLFLSADLPPMDSVVPQWTKTGLQVSLHYTTDALVNSISIALVSVVGTAVTPITENGWQLQWSASGQQLAYIADDAQIYVQAPNADTPFIISCQTGCESFVWLP